MLLLRGVKDRSGKLRIERKCEHAFERVSGVVPEFTAVRKLLDFGGDQPQPPGLGYALNHRGSLRRSRNAIFAIARWRQTQYTAVNGCDWETSAYIHSHG
jgi:hypothetical protein